VKQEWGEEPVAPGGPREDVADAASQRVHEVFVRVLGFFRVVEDHSDARGPTVVLECRDQVLAASHQAASC
jgi:hypothetical protein